MMTTTEVQCAATAVAKLLASGLQAARRQKRRGESARQGDFDFSKLKVHHVFATTLGGALYTEEEEGAASGQSGMVDLWNKKKNIPKVLEEAGKLRAELLGTTHQKLEDSGDAPRSADLIFAKSPADLKNLHENNSGGGGALILQHLEDRDGNTLLHWALERADEDCNWLHEDGLASRLCPGVNTKNSKGITPLHLAAQRNCPDCVRGLLDRGADAGAAEGEQGFTAALFSVIGCAQEWSPRCLGTLKRLAEEGGGARREEVLGARNQRGLTLAHAAAMHEDRGRGTSVLRYLLSVDLSFAHARDHKGETPLHAACRARKLNRAAVQAVLRVDGNLINTKDNEGLTPIMSLFCDGGGDYITPDLFSDLRFLLDCGADACAADAAGRTALHAALLGRGGDCGDGGEDAILWSCLELLIERGADPRIRCRVELANGGGEAKLTPAGLADRLGKRYIAGKLRKAVADKVRKTGNLPSEKASKSTSPNEDEDKKVKEEEELKRIAEEVIRKKIEELWK